MPAVNIQKYLEEEDKNGVKIGSWAVQVAPGVAECSLIIIILIGSPWPPLFRGLEYFVHSNT